MGLDITAYEKMVQIPESRVEDCEVDWDDTPNHYHPFAYSSFPESYSGFPHFLHGADLSPKFLRSPICYTTQGEKFRWHGGSYSGYSRFRATLAASVGVENLGDVWNNPIRFIDIPFFEILDFADNEGWIGPKACANLAKDFTDHKQAFLTMMEDYALGSHEVAKYENFVKGFTLASDGGAVNFH